MAGGRAGGRGLLYIWPPLEVTVWGACWSLQLVDRDCCWRYLVLVHYNSAFE